MTDARYLTSAELLSNLYGDFFPADKNVLMALSRGRKLLYTAIFYGEPFAAVIRKNTINNKGEWNEPTPEHT